MFNSNIGIKWKFLYLCAFCFFANGKSEEAKKLEEALNLLQKATVMLREIESNLDPVSFDESDYKLAIEHVKDGKYELARKILAPFSKGNSEKSAQALFWIGYCFMNEKNYEKSIFAFVSFLNRVGEFVANDMLAEMKKNANKNLVRCFEKLGRPADACAILKRMETEYPELQEYVQSELARLQ